MKDLIIDFVFYCLGQGGHAGCRERCYVPWHILCLRLFLIGGYRIKGALRGQSESGDDSIVLEVTQYDFHPPIGRVEGSFRRQRVMAKRRFKLSDAQESALYGAYVQCKDGPTRTRYQAVRLYGGGYALEEVIDITGCGRSSLMDWCRTYRKHGIDGLVDQRNGGNHRKLSAEQIADLRDRLHHYAPSDVLGPEAGAYWRVDTLKAAVEQFYGVVYRRRASYHRLFEGCRFRYERSVDAYLPDLTAAVIDFQEPIRRTA